MEVVTSIGETRQMLVDSDVTVLLNFKDWEVLNVTPTNGFSLTEKYGWEEAKAVSKQCSVWVLDEECDPLNLFESAAIRKSRYSVS